MNKQLQIPGCPPLPKLCPESDYGQPCERRIVWALLHSLASVGFTPYMTDATCDGDREALPAGVDPMLATMEAVFSVEEAHVYFRKEGLRPQWALFVVGNGQDILSDYSCPQGLDSSHPFTVAMGSFLDRIPDLL